MAYPRNSVSLHDAAHLVASVPTVTFLLSGQPGIGKSAMLGPIARATGLKPVYVDCTLLDAGDAQMPHVTPDGVTFVPNTLFVSDAPLLVMLDEIGKAPRAVQNTLLPLLYEHRIGAHHLPAGSRVFATTNLATDGVGDRIEAHAANRVTHLCVRNPSAEEWISWATAHGVHEVVTSWVHEHPHCLASYLEEGQGDNPYIFNPRSTGGGACVTPRSLERAGRIIAEHEHLTPQVLTAALTGTIGAPAAADMEAFLALRGDITTSWAQIMRDPAGAPVPTNPLASIMLVHRAIRSMDAASADPWMTYLQRLPREQQMLFGGHLLPKAGATPEQTERVQIMHQHSSQFTDWLLANHHALKI